MAQPILTVMNATATAAVTSWTVGEVKADQQSPILDVTVWNNKGGASDVSDVKEAAVTCLDGDGGDVSPMTTGLWMKVLVDTTAAVDGGGVKQYAGIGGATQQPVRAQGVLAAKGAVIKGTANDGTLANATNNFAKASFKVAPPFNAEPGARSFRIRFLGYYT